MRLARRTVVLSLAALGAAQSALAQQSAGDAVQLVTYFELLPTAVAECAPGLRKYAAESRSAPGSHGYLLLQDIARPNRFVTIEAWQDRASADGRGSARAALREALASKIIGGFDPRPYAELSTAPPVASSGRSIYVVTHIDASPAGMQRAADLARAEAAAARSDDGNLRYDVLRWSGHPNHFTLVSAWRDRKAAEASFATTHTRQFRAELAPLEGALYDERLYRTWP